MIKIYYINECVYCQKLKNKLTDSNIDFTPIDVNLPENEEEFNEIIKFTKNDLLPVVLINKVLLIPQKSFKTIDDLFETILKLIQSA
jgi:glutaredoxin